MRSSVARHAGTRSGEVRSRYHGIFCVVVHRGLVHASGVLPGKLHLTLPSCSQRETIPSSMRLSFTITAAVELQGTRTQWCRGLRQWRVGERRMGAAERGSGVFTTARRFGQAAFHAAGYGNRGGANRFFQTRLGRFMLRLHVWIAGGSNSMARLLNGCRVSDCR